MAPRSKSAKMIKTKSDGLPAPAPAMRRRPSMPELALKALVSFGRTKDSIEVVSDAELDSWRKPKLSSVQPYELGADLDDLSLAGDGEEVLDLSDDDREDDILLITSSQPSSRAPSPAQMLPKELTTSSAESSPLSPSFKFPMSASEAISSSSSTSTRQRQHSVDSLPASPPASPETSRHGFRRSGSTVFHSSNTLLPRPSLSSVDLNAHKPGLGPPPRRKKPLPPRPDASEFAQDAKPPVPPRRLIDSKAWRQVSLTESSNDARKAEYKKWKKQDQTRAHHDKAGAMTPPSTPPKQHAAAVKSFRSQDRADTPEAVYQPFGAMLTA